MAGFWCLLGHRRQDGCGNIPHKAVVYLYLFSHVGLSVHRIYGACILDEPEALYLAPKAKSAEVAVIFYFFGLHYTLYRVFTIFETVNNSFMANRFLSILLSIVFLFAVAPSANAGFRVKKQAEAVTYSTGDASLAGSVVAAVSSTENSNIVNQSSNAPIRRMQRSGFIGLLALVFGVLGFFHPIFAIGAVLCGIIGMSRRNWNTGLAITGFVLGLLAIGLSIFSSFAPLPIF